jgi:protein-arginine kinase activator protein McsA
MKDMLCQSCQKFQATLHQLDVVYDDAGRAEVLSSDYCASCAKQAGLPVPKATAFPKIMSMLSKAFLPPLQGQSGGQDQPSEPGATAASSSGGPSTEQDMPTCPHCGWTLRDLKQTSRLGCPHDYEVFSDFLGDMFERLHGFDSHVDPAEDEHSLDRLQVAMDKAVAAEDYEKAAEIRDRLQALDGPDAGVTPGDPDRPA